MKKIVWTFGIIAGLIVALLMGISIPMMKESVTSGSGEVLGYATMIVALSTIFFGIRSHRDKNLDGNISFVRAFQVGLYISLIASAIYVIAWIILSGLFFPDFVDQYTEGVLETLKESGATQDEITKQQLEMERFGKMYENPLFKAGITFLEIFPVGLVVSLISALILKKSNH